MNALILKTKSLILNRVQISSRIFGRKNKDLSVFFESLGIASNWTKKNQITIEELEDESGKNREDILVELNRRFGITFNQEIPLVRQVVTESVNKESTLLLERGYALSVDENREKIILSANLRALLGREKKLGGLPLGLTSKKTYNNYIFRVGTFKNFIAVNRKNGDAWRNVLALCILDAVVAGASDIYLGFPSRDSFQYIVKNKKYQGKLDERIFAKLTTLFAKGLSNRDIFNAIFPLEGGSCYLSETESHKSVTITLGQFLKVDKKVDKSLVIDSLQKSSESASSQHHILLIDDDERFIELLKRGISGKGYKVSVAVSANDALMYHLNSESSIDLIITDLNLPKMNGIQLIDTIRSRRPGMPIIVLTTEETTKSHVRIIEVGGDVVMHKKDDPQILLAWIKRLLGEKP